MSTKAPQARDSIGAAGMLVCVTGHSPSLSANDVLFDEIATMTLDFWVDGLQSHRPVLIQTRARRALAGAG